MSKHGFSLLENLDIVNCGSKTFSGDEAREDFYNGGAVLIEGANITGGDNFEFRGVGEKPSDKITKKWPPTSPLF